MVGKSGDKSQFIDDAVRTANANPVNVIIFIDGKKLTDLAIQYNAGVQVKEHYQVKTVDMDWFEEL